MICAWHVALNLRQKCDHRVTCGKHLSSLQNWVLPVTLDEVVIRLAKEQQLIHSELSIRKVRQIFCYIPDYSWQDLIMSSNVIFYKNDKNETRLWNGLPPGWCKLKLCASKGTVCIWKHYIVPCWVFQKKKSVNISCFLLFSSFCQAPTVSTARLSSESGWNELNFYHFSSSPVLCSTCRQVRHVHCCG